MIAGVRFPVRFGVRYGVRFIYAGPTLPETRSVPNTGDGSERPCQPVSLGGVLLPIPAANARWRASW